MANQFMSYSALEQYMRAVKWVPPFADGEEEQCLARLEGGKDVQEVRTRLVEGYQSLIVGLAKRYVRHCRNMEFMDLVQEGNLGLLQAISTYECSDDGASFRTWAFAWVRGAMSAALCRYEGAFHMPSQKVNMVRRMETTCTRLFSLLGREPTIAEIAGDMRIEESDVRELMVLQGLAVFSLHMPLDEDGETLLGDVIEDPTAAAFVEDDGSVDNILACLPERERLVIGLRYGFEDGQAYTQREVAERLGVVLSTVQMVDRRAKRHLCQALEERAS